MDKKFKLMIRLSENKSQYIPKRFGVLECETKRGLNENKIKKIIFAREEEIY